MSVSNMFFTVVVALMVASTQAAEFSTKISPVYSNTIPAIMPTGATGTNSISLDPTSMTGTTSTTLDNIKNFTVGHYHVGNATTNGPVVLVLYGKPSPVQSGTFTFNTTFNASSLQPVALGLTKTTDPTVVFALFVKLLESKELYANFHTTANPEGEIRAQI